MKNYSLLILLFVCILSKSQNVHILLEPDNPANCSIMKQGKFRDFNYDEKDYYMIMNDSIQIEYLENGKKYMRSKVDWLSDCKYKLTTIENTTNNTYFSMGDSTFVEIIETQQEKIKLRAIFKGDTAEALYIKISDSLSNSTDSPDNLIGKKSYNNPIDRLSYETDGQFVGYVNGEEIENSPENDTITGLYQVILLNSNQELEESLDIKKFSELIKTSKEIFNKNFSDYKGNGKIMVQFNLFKRKKAELQYTIKGDIDLDKMAQYEIDMNNEKFFKSKKYNIVFQIVFNINNK